MKAKILIAFVSLFIITLFIGCGQAEPDAGNPVRFETLSAGYNSQAVQSSHHVVKDQQQLESVLDMIGDEDIRVDFEESMVIAVFQGEQPTGGFEIMVEKIIETEQELIVYIEETVPSPDDIVTQALTSPYHLVKLEKIDKKVEFADN